MIGFWISFETFPPYWLPWATIQKLGGGFYGNIPGFRTGACATYSQARESLWNEIKRRFA